MNLPASNIPERELRKLVPTSYRKSLEGKVTSSVLDFTSYLYPLSRPKPRAGAKAAGLAFEGKVIREMEARFPCFLSSIPVRYYLPERNGMCIPDGLLWEEEQFVVFEVKLRHTVSAWYQLTNHYLPILSRALSRPGRGVEVVKWFDREVRFPESVKVYDSLAECLKGKDRISVLLWR